MAQLDRNVEHHAALPTPLGVRGPGTEVRLWEVSHKEYLQTVAPSDDVVQLTSLGLLGLSAQPPMICFAG